ncbi:DUF3592 domain-containing protein [Kitasatospora sp. NPDC004669]|uniref:DUF3592 domain-containing protein n=1 Tax=Kitasatospora sp. NPDC004669 TaxID=3154555 RepID=UPI00339FCE32
MGPLLFFVVGLAVTAGLAALSVRVILFAKGLAALRQRGVRTTGRVDSLRQLENSEGNPYERTIITFELPGERTGWTETWPRRPDGAPYGPGDEVKVLYDPEQPFRARVVHSDREQLPMWIEVVWPALLAALLAGAAVAAGWFLFFFARTELGH